MSADNAIGILITTDRFWQTNENTWINTGRKGLSVWRVAHLQNPEDFERYKRQEIHNLGWWMHQTFHNAPAFQTQAEATAAALALEAEIGYVEWGLMTFDARPRNFPGH